VKFWRVVEPMTRRSPEELMVVVAVPPILKELPVKMLEKRLVEVALVAMRLVSQAVVAVKRVEVAWSN